jgi:peptide deformylase
MKIVHYPHPALRHVSKPLTAIDKKVIQAAEEMMQLMFDARGLGLAANQVALPWRLIVLNQTPSEEGAAPQGAAYLNPVILERKGTQEADEGCLSLPDLYQKVRRAKTVKVQAYNLKGEPKEMTVSDLEARVWQHEIDHLDGILFIDKLGPIGKLSSRSALKEFERQFQRAQERGEIPPDAEIEQRLKELEEGV